MKPMMKTRLPILACLLAALGSVQAATVFTDTFDSGTGDWYRYASNGTLENTSQQLSWTRANTGLNETIGRSFNTQTIDVGESIRFSFDFTQSSGTATTGNIIRAGLYNVTTPITADNWGGGNNVGAWSGYYTFIRDGSSSGNVARRNSDTSTSGSVGPSEGGSTITNPADSTSFNIVNGTTYQGAFEVFRTSANQMTTLFTLSSGATTHFSVQGITTTVQSDFNTVVLRTASDQAQLFDNMQVTAIPEPSAALLGSLGLLCLLRRRR